MSMWNKTYFIQRMIGTLYYMYIYCIALCCMDQYKNIYIYFHVWQYIPMSTVQMNIAMLTRRS